MVLCIWELAIRFYAFRWSAFLDDWVKFDFFLVSIGIVLNYVISPFLEFGGVNLGFLRMTKTIRVLRLAKALRLQAKFKVLWVLVRCLTNSFATMGYTLLILFVMVYVFASLGMELIRDSSLNHGPNADEEFQAIVTTYFTNLPTAMLTLLQFVCLDSVAEIYRPMIIKEVDNGSCFLLFYFILVILVLSIVLMNLVTAVIVNGAMEADEQDKDVRKVLRERETTNLLKAATSIFNRLDVDGSGSVTTGELKHMTANETELLLELCCVPDLDTLFHFQDDNNDGKVSIEEFCMTIHKAATSKTPWEAQYLLNQTNYFLHLLRRHLGEQPPDANKPKDAAAESPADNGVLREVAASGEASPGR